MKSASFLCAATLVFSGLSPSPALSQDAAAPDVEMGDSAFSVIPADVLFALAVRSYKDLKADGDKLIKDSGIAVPLRPSDAVDWLFTSLKVRDGLDEDAPFALMILDDELFMGGEDSIAYAVPFSDKAKMAANFGRKPEDFEEGVPIANLGKNGLGLEFPQVALRGRWFYAGSKKALAAILPMKSVEESLTPDQRKLLPKADLVFHFSRAGFADEWEREFVRDIEAAADEGEEDPRVKRLATTALPLAKHFRLGEIAMRVDGGLALQGFALFDPVPAVQKSLDTIAGGRGQSHLTALPEGPIVASVGATGDGRINGDLARDFLSLLTDDFFGRQGDRASVDRNAFFGIFDEVWNSLRGSRGALYQNVDLVKHGRYSTVAILDPDDVGGFRERLQDLALYVNHASDQLSDGEEPAVEEVKIRELIGNLAAADFRLRAEATTRLALLGDDALPALKKAMESADPEVRMRATALHGRLETLSTQRERDLIKGDVFSKVRPRFIYFPDAEERGGYPVDIVQFTFAEDAGDTKDALRDLFGPEWEKIRLVRKDEQIVLLAGSDLGLLDTAIANLEAGDSGLEESESLAGYRNRTVPVRKAEVHFSMARVLPMFEPDGVRRPDGPKPEPPKAEVGITPPLSSYGLSIQPSSLAFDWYMPASELGIYYNIIRFL